MEAQIIQASPQIRFVGGSAQCKDCEEEQRLENAIKKDRTEDRVSLSPASFALADDELKTGALKKAEEQTAEPATGPKTDMELSEEEHRILAELRARDAEVRAHEQAHLAAAGPYANGAPTYEYQTGPDGKQYAVGGEVSIDTSPVPGDPQATARKAQAIKRAALAPRDPSAQDRKVAGQAAQLEAQARQEVQAEKAEEKKEAAESQNNSSPAEAGDASTSNSDSPSESGQDAPFAKRVTDSFKPASIASGNLLDIIS